MISPYAPADGGGAPRREKTLSDLHQYSMATKALLTSLGDFWTDYYRDTLDLANAASGAVTAFSRAYDDMLQRVLSSSIVDIPPNQGTDFDLLVFREDDLVPEKDKYGVVQSYYCSVPDLEYLPYLTTNLFESPIILEEGVHYELEKGKGVRFFVDLMNDEKIVSYAYSMADGATRMLLLWGCSIAFSSTLIYERFGRFLYKKSSDSEHYKWVVESLMHYYANAKSCTNIQNMLNILYGIPYTRYRDETILRIAPVDENLVELSRADEAPYYLIETDKNSYYTYAFSEMQVKVGQTVPQYTLLSSFNEVSDYIKSPGWWEDIKYPIVRMESDDGRPLSKEEENDLMDKVLKYNTTFFKLGVSYETYDTYCAQVDEIMSIIRTGFPVYLYPFVQTVFYVVFTDTLTINEDILDLLKDMVANFRFRTQYHYGEAQAFDGSVSYYMEPCRTHGKDSTTTTRLFNGEVRYAREDDHYHGNEYRGVPTFDGSESYHVGCFEYNHGSEVEGFSFDVSMKMETEMDWDPVLLKKEHLYDGSFKHDGANSISPYTDEPDPENTAHPFGTYEEYRHRDEIRILYRDTQVDHPDDPEDSETTVARPDFPDRPFEGTPLFDGSSFYRKMAEDFDGWYEEKLKSLLKWAPWESEFHWRTDEPMTCPKYSGDFFHEGSERFGWRRDLESFDRMLTAITPEFTEKGKIWDSIPGFSSLISVTDALADTIRSYDGNMPYSGTADHEPGGWEDDFEISMTFLPENI